MDHSTCGAQTTFSTKTWASTFCILCFQIQLRRCEVLPRPGLPTWGAIHHMGGRRQGCYGDTTPQGGHSDLHVATSQSTPQMLCISLAQKPEAEDQLWNVNDYHCCRIIAVVLTSMPSSPTTIWMSQSSCDWSEKLQSMWWDTLLTGKPGESCMGMTERRMSYEHMESRMFCQS